MLPLIFWVLTILLMAGETYHERDWPRRTWPFFGLSSLSFLVAFLYS